MNATVIIFVIFILISFLYGMWSYKSRANDIVYITEAGPTDGNDCILQQHYHSPAQTYRLSNGEYRSSKDFFHIKVSGNCMASHNIFNGEEWLAERIDHSKSCQSQIAPKDVLFIYIKDKNIYKLREFSALNEDGSLRTLYYDKQGNIKYSSTPHSYSSILGVVKYNI